MVDLTSPAGEGSAEMSLFATENFVYMSWITSGSSSSTIYVARFDGKSWHQPLPVYTSDQLFVNWADFPKLLATDKLLACFWLEKNGAGTFSYDVRYSISDDQGKSWSPGKRLHTDTRQTEHGFPSAVALDTRTIGVVWLDGRDLKMGKDHMAEGNMQLLFRTITPDGPGPEEIIDPDTCECCNTDLVLTQRGLLAAFRNKTADHIRDIYLARRLKGNWQKAVPLHEDGWKLQGCPVNGPALAVHGKTVAAAWFTGAGTHRLGLTVSHDDGHTFGKPLRFAVDAQGRVDLALMGNQKLALSWLAPGDTEGLIKLAFFTCRQDPVMQGAPITVDTTPAGRQSGFPRMVYRRDRLILAYQDPASGDTNRIKIKQITWQQPSNSP